MNNLIENSDDKNTVIYTVINVHDVHESKCKLLIEHAHSSVSIIVSTISIISTVWKIFWMAIIRTV